MVAVGLWYGQAYFMDKERVPLLFVCVCVCVCVLNIHINIHSKHI